MRRVLEACFSEPHAMCLVDARPDGVSSKITSVFPHFLAAEQHSSDTPLPPLEDQRALATVFWIPVFRTFFSPPSTNPASSPPAHWRDAHNSTSLYRPADTNNALLPQTPQTHNSTWPSSQSSLHLTPCFPAHLLNLPRYTNVSSIPLASLYSEIPTLH